MESRTITVIDSRNQRKYVLSSIASTLGDLKADLINAGISDLDDVVFKEGTTRAEYSDDSSTLPTNVMYRGRQTNDLAFMIIPPRRKIKSGNTAPLTTEIIMNMSRIELYTLLKQCNLESAIQEKYNTNFTRVSNEDLRETLVEYLIADEDAEDEDDNSFIGVDDVFKSIDNIQRAVDLLITELVDNDCLYFEVAEEIRDMLFNKEEGYYTTVNNKSLKSEYSDEDLRNMFE